MAKYKIGKKIRNLILLVFLNGFVVSFFLRILLQEEYFDPVIIFWVGTLSLITFLIALWYYRKKLRPVIVVNEQIKRNIDRGRHRIVLIGGGTGLSTVLRGVRNYSSYDNTNISAIVTVADDGGSSGKLRKEMDIIAPGDIRNCIVALSREENLLSRLFNFRFNTEGELSGHSFGNLFLAALADLNGGDFEKAIKTACDILAVKGKIIPATLENVNISATLDDGSILSGESEIGKKNRERKIKSVDLHPSQAKANREAIRAIDEADAVILGPGSLFTSIIPNLLFPGIANALKRSNAMKIFVCNIMTQPGETDGFSVSDHIKVLEKHIPGVINYVIVNNAKMSYNLLEKYKEDGAYPVETDIGALKKMKILPVQEDLIKEGDYFRHNHDKLANLIIRLVEESVNI